MPDIRFSPWLDETPYPGPVAVPVLHFSFPKGTAHPGDLYHNESAQLLYRYGIQEYRNNGRIKRRWDWIIVARTLEGIKEYLELTGYA